MYSILFTRTLRLILGLQQHLCLICFQWRPEINHHISAASCILVGTHTDLRDDADTLRNLAENEYQMLTPDDGTNLAQKINAATYLECSTKTLVRRYTYTYIRDI